MFTISIDSTAVQGLFKNLGLKMPKVMADTVNVLGGKVKTATINEMRTKFKGGTSNWVLNSFGISKATASNPTAVVKYNRGRAFMKTQVEGGVRPATGAEGLLQRKSVLPSGMRMLPGPGAARDQYGNLGPGIRSKVLSFFQTYSGTNARNNRQGARSRSGDSFFSVSRAGTGHLPMGIYQRVDAPQATAMRAQRALIAKRIIQTRNKGKAGTIQRQSLMKELKAVNKALLPRGIKMVVAFDDITAYTPLIKFYDIGRKIVADNLVRTFHKVAAIELGNRLSR